MKINRLLTSAILATAAALVCPSSSQATPNFTVAAFATGTQGKNSGNDGTYGQYNGDCIEVGYGAGTIVWDGITYDAADGSTGAAYITANFSSANNTEDYVMMGPGYNNWYNEGDSGSCPTGTVDGTQYHAIQFDILYDTNSSLTLSQFNTGQGWPTSYFVNPAVGPDYMATNSYYTDGLNVSFFTGSGGGTVSIGSFQVPANAATGWQTVTIPYSDTIAGLGPVAGVLFNGYFGGGGELVGNYNASFWIDNVQLIGNQTVSPPPTMTNIFAATPGLNIFNASVGTGAYPYVNRNEVVAKSTSGLSWVGHPPASYSFNLAGFPKGPDYSGEAYLLLIANSVAEDNAPDYNEANVMQLEVQSRAAGSWVTLSYKAAEPNSETYTTVTNVGTPLVLGNYTLTFTGNDAGTITTPDGTVTAFSLPAGTGASNFAENGSEPYNFLIYLGGQANDPSFINHSVVYQSITVSGPPNGAAVSENFLADANAATPALQNWGSTWTGNGTTTPADNVLVPSGAPYWVNWTLPSSGYALAETASLKQPAAWKSASAFSPVAMYNIDAQLVSTNDLQSPTNDQYFAMIHRTASQLLVILPGQTFTPGAAPGYSGTPTAVSLNDNPYVEENVTVMTVDSAFNPVPSSTDTISLTTTDGGPNGAVDPNPAAMVNGTITFSSGNPFLFGDSGSWTITAMDATTPAIAAGTSAAVTVNP